MSTKAIVIHTNPAVQEWVGSLKPEWDVQVPVTSPNDVWDFLENGSLSGESQILFISDLFYSENADEFAAVVASFAPTLLVIVIAEQPETAEGIQQAVSVAVEQYELEHGPYYFFDTSSEDPVGQLDNILQAYIARVNQQQEAPPVQQIQPVEEYAAPVQQPTPDTNLGGLEDYDPTAPQQAAPQVQQPTPQPEEQASFGDYTAEEIGQIENTLGEPGLIVASTSSKGGSGKTTNALGTAITIAMGSRLAHEQGSGYQPLKVCIVDMDVRDGQIGFAINQNSPSILNLYVMNEDNMTVEAIRKNIIKVPRYEIDCLLAPKRGRTADYLTPAFYLDVLRNLRLMYDVIILDTSVNYLDPLLGQVVYPESDAILLVTNLAKGAVLGMPRWIDEVTSDEDGGPAVPLQKIGVVINQSLGGVGMDLELVKKAAKGAPLLVAIPADNRAVTKASNEGTLNDLIRKHETIGAEYFKLAQKVWRKTPLSSPLQAYLDSPEKERDDALAAKGKTDNTNAVSTFTPLAGADEPKRRFGRS